MAVNKIIYSGKTLGDLTSDTVTADNLAEGITATAADGKKVVGVMQKGEIASYDEIDNALALAGTGTVPSGGVVTIAQGGTGATTAAQARANLGAVAAGDLASVATSGNYNDLTNKPAIPSTANTKLTGTTTAETLTVTSALNIPGGQIWIG